MEKYLKVGTITTTHGIHGEVKVYPATDSPERFLDLSYVIVEPEKENRELSISQVRFFKNLVILKFAEFDSINDIQPFRGKDLYIRREDGAVLEENEYYIADLLGMNVLLEDGRAYGVLREVLETGANDVYIVRKPDGKEILIPAIHDCILSVDVEKNEMVVHLLKGLDESME